MNRWRLWELCRQRYRTGSRFLEGQPEIERFNPTEEFLERREMRDH
jgi:hypothetical protein